MKILTVVSAFGSYERGAQISEPSDVASALESHAAHVVAIEVPDRPKPAKAPPAPSAD